MDELVGCLTVMDPVEDVRPALQGDALEDGEHGEDEVVKVGDAVVGTLPELLQAPPSQIFP